MAGVSIHVTGQIKEFEGKLYLLATLDWRDMHREFGEAILTSTMARWKKEVNPTGRPWTPLSPRTLKRKRGERILVEHRTLQNSITYRAYSDRVIVGSNVVYAGIHQFGGFAGRGRKVKIPARPYLGVSQEDLEELEGIVNEKLREVLE